MTRIASLLLLGFLVLGLGRPALAGRALAKAGSEKRTAEKPTADRVAKEKAAKKACATGNYQEGVDTLADLFVDTNDVVYVYNQGRCYQQNNRWEQAISRFQEYLRKARDLPASERAETQRQIDDCQESLAKASPAVPPPMAATNPTPAAQSATPAPLSQPEPTDLHSTASQGSRGKGLRVAGLIVAGVGVAAVGTGVGLALKANSLSTAEYSRSRESERSSLRTWGFVSYGVGAAAIATGAVLYVVGWTRRSSSSVAFLPSVAPDGASLSLQGSF